MTSIFCRSGLRLEKGTHPFVPTKKYFPFFFFFAGKNIFAPFKIKTGGIAPGLRNNNYDSPLGF